MTPRFPISDHCDGEYFFNPGANAQPRGLAQVLRWRLQTKRVPWERPPPDPKFPAPPAEVAAGTAAVSFINHATFLIRLPGAVILTEAGSSRNDARTLAQRVSHLSPRAVSFSKQLIHQGRLGTPRRAALALERERFVDLFDGEDQREGVEAFFEKRKPVWKNA